MSQPFIARLGLALLPAALPVAPVAGQLAIDSGAGNALKVYNGTAWQNAGSTPPGGSDTMVQFNDGGAFGGVGGFVFDKTNFRLGISNGAGTFAPAATIHISKDTNAGFRGDTYSATATATAALQMYRARGTAAAPTAVQSGDTLGMVSVFGYGATGFSAASRANLTFLTAETWTDSAQGTTLQVNVTAAGGVATAQAASFDSLGLIVGTAAPTAPATSRNLRVQGRAQVGSYIANGSVYGNLGASGVNAALAAYETNGANNSVVAVLGVCEGSANTTLKTGIAGVGRRNTTAASRHIGVWGMVDNANTGTTPLYVIGTYGSDTVSGPTDGTVTNYSIGVYGRGTQTARPLMNNAAFFADASGGALNYALFANTGVVQVQDTTTSTSSTTGAVRAVGGIASQDRIWAGTGFSATRTIPAPTGSAGDALDYRQATIARTSGASASRFFIQEHTLLFTGTTQALSSRYGLLNGSVSMNQTGSQVQGVYGMNLAMEVSRSSAITTNAHGVYVDVFDSANGVLTATSALRASYINATTKGASAPASAHGVWVETVETYQADATSNTGDAYGLRIDTVTQGCDMGTAYGVFIGNITAPGPGGTAYGIFSNAKVRVADATAASTASTGALVVDGGMGVGGAGFFGGDLTIGSTSATDTKLKIVYPFGYTAQIHLQPGGGLNESWILWADNFMGTDLTLFRCPGGIQIDAFTVSMATGAGTWRGVWNITDTTASTSSTTGALVVAGGVGVSGSVNVDGAVTATLANGSAIVLSRPLDTQQVTLEFRTGSLARWGWRLQDAETGSNAGGRLTLLRRNDDGTPNGDVINFDRATGIATFSSQIRVGDGTAALPGLAFGNDTDSGLYRFGSSMIGVSLGGISSMLFQAGLTYLDRASDTSTTSPEHILRRSRTTGVQVLSGDRLGGLRFQGFDAGGNGRTGALIIAAAEEDITSTTSGSRLEFLVTPIGSSTAQSRMSIMSSGGVRIGSVAGDPGVGNLSCTGIAAGAATSLLTFAFTVTPTIQIRGTAASVTTYGTARFSNDASGSAFYGAKSRGALDAFAATSSGDALLTISAQGVDTTAADFREAARILFSQDAAGGASAVPGRITFHTSTTGGTITEALRINSAQQVSIPTATASSSTTTGALIVSGGVGVGGALWVGEVDVQNNSTTGQSMLVCRNNTGNYWLFTMYGSAFPGSTFGYTNAGVAYLATNSSVRMLIGPNTNVPINIGIGSTEVMRFTGETLSSQSARILYTTAASSTTTGALVVSGGIGAGGAVYIGGALGHTGSTLGVFNTAPTTKQTVSGAKGGNAALASLLTALAAYGLITDSTSA